MVIPLRAIAISGSLLTAAMSTGCLGVMVPPASDRPAADIPSAAETAQISVILESMTRGQQAYYLEMDEFASTIDDLEVGVSSEESGYQLAIAEVTPDQVIMTANTEAAGAPLFSAAVFIVPQPDGEGTTTAIVCESAAGMPTPRLEGEEAVCEEAQ